MAHFIELHKTDDEQTPICLNVDNIAYIEPNETVTEPI